MSKTYRYRNVPVFEYRHVVAFEETNVVGNVYYVNYLSWQGRCRELFFRQYMPELMDELDKGLALATVRCSCDFFAELFAFDEVAVRMHVHALAANRVTLGFEYLKVDDGKEQLVARGEQEIASMRREAERLVPAPLPSAIGETMAYLERRFFETGLKPLEKTA